jgi:arylsulfatase A-like enzyme
MRPNVILIVLDTARADALEPYGAVAGSTPAIADLAHRGRAFDQVHAAASWTLPSHAAMFTGMLPRATGILDLPEGTPLAARATLEAHADRALPSVLHDAGYATAAVSTNLWVTAESGFAAGFDRFRFVDTRRQEQMHGADVRSRFAWDLEGVRARADDGAEVAGEVLRSWLAETGERPFFWFVNLVECHSPYLPPRPYNDLGGLDRLRAAREARHYLTLEGIWRACAGGFDVPDEALARMRHLYARSVRLMDDWLADLLEALDRSGALDETLVVVTADHGENFGEGGFMGHCFSLDQRLIRVPFVIAGPGAPEDPGVTSLASLPKLIAETVGLDQHPWSNGLPGAGFAAAQFEPPAPAGDPRWTEAFDKWEIDHETAAERVGRPLTAATDGRWKLQLRGDREELYDLVDDPLELAPREPSAGDETAVTVLRRVLAEVTAQRPVAAALASPQPQISDEERRRLEDRMRLLGYM